ncbi:MAG: hypothetical protein J6V76_06945 [Bacteroidales bacterium]|nr:hypothetical protein [Bacteroidales bacterium]
MKKLFYLAAVAALALASCKSGNNNNAEGNATEGTEQTQDAAAQQAAADEQALASAKSFQGWIESINGQDYIIRNAEGQTITVKITNPGEELIEGEPIIIKYIEADGANKAATDNAKSVDLSQAVNFKKLLGKWGTANNEITFELRKSGKCKNVGKDQKTEFKSWRMKDNNTIEFEVANGESSFFMPWGVENLSDNAMTLTAGENSKLEMTRIDSNRE